MLLSLLGCLTQAHLLIAPNVGDNSLLTFASNKGNVLTAGGDTGGYNTLNAINTNGSNNLNANATTGTNNVETKTNKIGVATASSINTIGNGVTSTNTIPPPSRLHYQQV